MLLLPQIRTDNDMVTAYRLNLVQADIPRHFSGGAAVGAVLHIYTVLIHILKLFLNLPEAKLGIYMGTDNPLYLPLSGRLNQRLGLTHGDVARSQYHVISSNHIQDFNSLRHQLAVIIKHPHWL